MKYPQLVSTRAVNAISDWLVSRLEQLGVEAPQIYTRLLLSLLQSAVQINDPIEFNNLESFVSNRKGGHKRYPPTDTDTLKKLNAVQCLREIVSSDEEISTIENLVEELFEKLRIIEKQTAEAENDDFIEFLSSTKEEAASVHPNHQHKNQNHQQQQQPRKYHHHTGREDNQKPKYLSAGTDNEIESDTDPKRRYFRAFPALSKEMEDSFSIWRQNSKALTWPMDRNKHLAVSTSSSSSSTISTSTSGNDAKNNQSKSLHQSNIMHKSKRSDVQLQKPMNVETKSSTIGYEGMNKKARRRRRYSRSKGKGIQTIRKNSFSNNSGNGKNHRNIGITYWDTEFEGCWEMGRDLIKEFIDKQNKHQNCQRKMKEASDNKNSIHTNDNLNASKLENFEAQNNSEVLDTVSKMKSPLIVPHVDISFCDEDYDETIASLSEITGNESLTGIAPRRLYERVIKLDSQELMLSDQTALDHDDFLQFKAKFNSSIEALWKDVDQNEESNANEAIDGSFGGDHNIQLSSMPIMAPFKEDLKNFWTNYYNHQLETQKTQQHQPQHQQQDQDQNTKNINKMETKSNNFTYNDFNNINDYYSMPSTIDEFERSVGGIRRDRNTSIGVYFQNSIWSDNSYGVSGIGDTDESFYYKVWNSSKKLQQLGVGNKDKLSNYDADTYFPPYNVSKWSEGINAGPNTTQQLGMSYDNNHGVKCNVDCVDGAPAKCGNNLAYNWPQMPKQSQSLQSDYQSWSSSNPMSLNEIYDNGVADKSSRSIENDDESLESDTDVTLENHSNESSGFIVYSKIKKVMQTTQSHPIETTQNNYSSSQASLRPKERYNDDENLLTSERTHFYPIKTFADGHTFDIRGTLDVIEYERSSSGYLYLETDKYLEYTRIDNFIAEEDGSTTGGYRTTTAPLYATSNCDAISGSDGDVIDDAKRNVNEFLIHFRVCNIEIGCQTEPIPETLLAESTESSSMCLIFNDRQQQQQQKGANNNFDVANNHWLPINNIKKSANHQTCVWTSAQPQPTDAGAFTDELDYVKNSNNNCVEDELSCSSNGPFEQQWSMQAIGKKCLSNGHAKAKHAKDDAGVHADGHTLWGMCPACNNELKSIPANRLLRDELQIEADEIMSDLKYMQDLYICRADDTDESNESDCDTMDEAKEDKRIAMPKKKDRRNVEEDAKDRMLFIENGFIIDDGIDGYKSNSEPQDYQEQSDTKAVLLRMNRLIVDLLRPENAAKISSIVKEKDSKSCNDSEDGEGRQNIGNGSSFMRGEHNIWQQSTNAESNGLKPTELANALQVENDKFLTQLSWEHNNLAKIWQTPSTIENQDECKVGSTQLADDINDELNKNENVAKVQTHVEIENMKNLQQKNLCANAKPPLAATNVQVNSITTNLTPIITTPNGIGIGIGIGIGGTNVAAFKRVQHLLNSNISTNATNKLKLANRKRRHSASQNLFHHVAPGLSTPINNNNMALTDLNKINLKANIVLTSNSQIPYTKLKNNNNSNDNNNIVNNITDNFDKKLINCSLKKQHELLKKANSNDCDYDGYVDGDINVDEQIEPKQQQTIITCKYWTTMEPMPECIDMMMDESAATFSCMLDKNASILKHVTMVTRPLTR